jgi:ABC-2 type transport system ATP-binding protein
MYLEGRKYTTRPKPAQGQMGIVPDESNLYDELSGFENLSFCAALYCIDKSERRERARALLEQFGLEQAGKRPFKTYSKGMKRKLTIAAGIIHRPKILFLDEPTTGIDVASARQIRSLIGELNRRGTTVFLTTHYIEEAERLCHRIAFIVGGRLVRIGAQRYWSIRSGSAFPDMRCTARTRVTSGWDRRPRSSFCRCWQP